jgi:hypothetical protein
MPRVTVVLPTHNRSEVVGYAIDSVLAQTEPDFELLVVGDGCTDDTAEVVASRRDPRIRFFDLPKAPHFGYANRNVALREARGELVGFVAHDNLVLPDHLERLSALLARTGCEWAYSRPLWVSGDGVIVPFATNLTNADELEYFLTVGNTVPATCILFRRECLDRYGYIPEDVPSAADWRYWIAILGSGGGANLAYEPIPTCLHFKASWRPTRFADSGDVQRLLAVADGAAWWPPVLRHEVPPATLEQAVVADALRRGGPAWTESLRAGVATVIDRLAWDSVRVTMPRCEDLERRLDDTERTVDELRCAQAAIASQLAAATQELEALGRRHRATHDELAATLASVSWRLTAPLRAVKRAILG